MYSEEIQQKTLEDLYTEYAYAFIDFSDFSNFINKYLNKTNLEQEKNIYYSAKKYILRYIRKSLENNKINILLNYITSNIDINNNPYEELMKIVNYLRKINYIPTSNLIIKLLSKSKEFNYLITKVGDKDLPKKYQNELLLLFLEIYHTLNENDLQDKEDEKDNFLELEIPAGYEAIINEIKAMDLPVLTKEEEHDLLIKIKQGDREAYQYFYEHNLRLVLSIVKKFVNRNVPIEDLFQEGSIGLMLAIEHFEIESGYKFSTYATCSIKRNIIIALAKYSRTIRIPRGKSENLYRYSNDILELEKEMGHELTDQEIAKHLKISIEEVQTNNVLLKNCLSLNNRVSEEDDAELGNFICDDTDIENDIFTSELSKEMKKLFHQAGLTKSELFVLKYRWGLDNVPELSLDKLGKHFGVTRERIRQIETKAINKLRKCPFLENFIYYLDNPDKGMESINNLVSYQAVHKYSKFEDKSAKKSIYSLTFVGLNYSKEEMNLAISMLDNLDKEILQLFYDVNIIPTTINNTDINKYRDDLYERVIPNLGQILENIRQKKLSRK